MFFIKNRVCEKSSLTELGIVIRRCIAVMHFFFSNLLPQKGKFKIAASVLLLFFGELLPFFHQNNPEITPGPVLY